MTDRNSESKGGSLGRRQRERGRGGNRRVQQPLWSSSIRMADSSDFVTYPVMGDAIHPHIAEPLYRATGLAVLLDGRLAIAANGRLLLFRQQ